MSWIAANLKNKHCFFGRKGGVSQGVFAGLNVSPKGCDSEEELKQNLAIAAGWFGEQEKSFALLNQGVSADVFYIDEPSSFVITGDGMVTDKPGIILGLRTADCAPVLLEDAKNGVIGVAHAGWRGAFKGIIEKTVEMMQQKGAEVQNIAAAVGPCIAQDSYEVEESFYQSFWQKNKDFKRYFKDTENNRYLFDLERFCVDRLHNCGVTDITASRQDTYKNEDEYYSFRRFTHQGKVKTNGGFASQMSAIVLQK